MSIHTFERFSDIREMNPFKKRRLSQEIAATALATDVTPAYDPVRSQIDEIKQLPEDRMDQQLSTLISLANTERDASDTGDIPAVLADAIHDTADHLVSEWQRDQFTYLSVVALTNAYALTKDHHLIEAAVDAVHEKPSFVSYLPDVADAVERAAETGEDYQTAMRQVQKPQRDLAMAIHAADAPAGHHNEYPGVVTPVPMEEYDFLFHPTARRPNTPEYVYGGIHPSLRKK